MSFSKVIVECHNKEAVDLINSHYKDKGSGTTHFLAIHSHGFKDIWDMGTEFWAESAMGFWIWDMGSAAFCIWRFELILTLKSIIIIGSKNKYKYKYLINNY